MAKSSPTLCECGHDLGWHSHGGAGDCEYDADCPCGQFFALAGHEAWCTDEKRCCVDEGPVIPRTTDA